MSELEKSKKERQIVEQFLVEKSQQGDLISFTLATMPHYEVNWHHLLLADYAKKLISGEVTRLMVFMPPRHGKSELVSVRLPAFILGLDPNTQIIGTSYGAELASKMNRSIQRVIDSHSYQRIFPNTTLNNSNIRTVSSRALRNSDVFEIVGHRGGYRSAGIGGAITGSGADLLLIDDPIKNREEADSLTYREKIWDWYTSTAYTRLEKNARVLLVMTRWHEDDLAGRLLKEQRENPDADKWHVLSLEAIKQTENPNDKRAIGEALWPWKFNEERLAGIKGTIGSRDWSALYQQSPAPIEGALFKRHWWKFYREAPKEGQGVVVQFWDCAQKVGISTDYSVCATWMKTQSGFYLLDLWRGKVEAPELELTIKTLFFKWKPMSVVIEDKSSGSSVIQNLRRSTTLPIIPFVPKESKEIRASAATPTVEAGNCFLPNSAIWLEDFLKEHEVFPSGQHDDQVDTTSMMVNYFSKFQNNQQRIRTL